MDWRRDSAPCHPTSRSDPTLTDGCRDSPWVSGYQHWAHGRCFLQSTARLIWESTGRRKDQKPAAALTPQRHRQSPSRTRAPHPPALSGTISRVSPTPAAYPGPWERKLGRRGLHPASPTAQQLGGETQRKFNLEPDSCPLFQNNGPCMPRRAGLLTASWGPQRSREGLERHGPCRCGGAARARRGPREAPRQDSPAYHPQGVAHAEVASREACGGG